jgi:hypothetical protein
MRRSCSGLRSLCKQDHFSTSVRSATFLLYDWQGSMTALYVNTYGFRSNVPWQAIPGIYRLRVNTFYSELDTLINLSAWPIAQTRSWYQLIRIKLYSVSYPLGSKVSIVRTLERFCKVIETTNGDSMSITLVVPCQKITNI